MGDLNKLLEGNVDEVKGAIGDLSHVDLHSIRKIETAGKNRAGVLHAVDAALAAKALDGTASASTAGTLDRSPLAELPAADAIDTSGAPQQIVPDVDMTHPAVDANPRANTTETQNRIDFNDPNRDGREVVEEALSQANA